MNIFLNIPLGSQQHCNILQKNQYELFGQCNTIAKIWRQPNCLSIYEWKIRCSVYTQWKITQLLKKETNNEILPFGAIWMDLEVTMLSEISQMNLHNFQVAVKTWYPS